MKRLSPEEAFLCLVLELAKLFAWRRAHIRPARTKTGWRTAVQADGKGFPDTLLVRAATGHLIVAELKVPPNVCTPEQEAWLADFRAAGIPAFEWTPDDWDEIKRVLRDGA